MLNRPSKPLNRLVKDSVVWVAIDRGAVQCMNLLSSMLLARLLAPADFGVMGIVVMFTGLSSRMVQFGFGMAVIQRAVVTSEHLAALLILTGITNGAVFVTLIAAAPYIGAYFNNPIVGPVLAVMSVNFLLRIAGACPSTLLRRVLNTKAIATASIMDYSVKLSVTGILALKGYGVWSLVYGEIAGGVADKLWLTYASGWKPSLRTSREAMQDLLKFGVTVSFRDTLVHLSNNVDNFVIGKWLGVASLGYYEKAYKLMDLPVKELSGRTSAILFPAFAQIHQDAGRLRSAFRKTVLTFSAAGYPLFGTLVVLGPQFISVLYGPQWAATIVPFQILCLAGPARILTVLGSSVLGATAEVGAEARRRVEAFLLLAVGCFVASWWSVSAVAWAVAAGNLVLMARVLQFLISKSTVRLRDIWAPQTVPLMATAMMMAVEAGIRHWLLYSLQWHAVGVLAGTLATGGATYLVLLYVMRNEALDSLFKELRGDLLPLIGVMEARAK
jgi:O-antigen/teichoic acid export membrane protein